MRHLTIVALVLYLGVASLHSQGFWEQHSTGRRVKMRFSGSIISSPLVLAPNTLNHEEHLEGSSTLGLFTYRGLWADDPATQTVGTCGSGSGPNFQLVIGGGVFRFSDGSLLTVRLTGGVLCIDFSDLARPVGHLSETFLITGGTGRFDGVAAHMTPADCTLQLTAMRSIVLRDSANAVKFMTSVGEMRGLFPTQQGRQPMMAGVKTEFAERRSIVGNRSGASSRRVLSAGMLALGVAHSVLGQQRLGAPLAKFVGESRCPLTCTNSRFAAAAARTPGVNFLFTVRRFFPGG